MRLKELLLSCILLSSVTLAASPAQGCECAGTALYIHAFSYPSDQHEMIRSAAIDIGPDAVQSAVLPVGVPERYLVLVTSCEAYSCSASTDIPPRVEKRAIRSSAVAIPDDHPLEWQTTTDLAVAITILGQHADAKASGLTSLARGGYAVYWTKETW